MFGIRLRRPRGAPPVDRDTASADPAYFGARAAITDFLFVRDEPCPVDFAFVLGSPTVSSVEPAIALYLRGLTSRLVISGLGPTNTPEPPPRAEAEIYREHAVRQGVRECDIWLETKATNTLENFRFTSDLVERHLGWDSIRSVSISGKPYHMRRALMTARAHWPKHLQLVMLPSDHPQDAPAETWWQTEWGRKSVLAELRSIGTYALNGDLAGF